MSFKARFSSGRHGELFVDLKAQSRDEAIIEMRSLFRYECDEGSGVYFDTISILEIAREIEVPHDEWLQEWRDDEYAKEQAEQRARAQFHYERVNNMKNSKQNSNLDTYLAHIEFETGHRRRWIKKAVKDKRYIRGTIAAKIKGQIHSRDTNDRTTDYRIREKVLAKTGGKCYLCWRQWNPLLALLLPHLYFAIVQVDHIIPFSKFGPNSLSNYMPVCSKCNNKKSDLSLAEYRAGVKRSRWGKR